MLPKASFAPAFLIPGSAPSVAAAFIGKLEAFREDDKGDKGGDKDRPLVTLSKHYA